MLPAGLPGRCRRGGQIGYYLASTLARPAGAVDQPRLPAFLAPSGINTNHNGIIRMVVTRFLSLLVLLAGFSVQAEPLSYSKDVQPIFTRHCVACHACFDAPCQLNLGSAEGVARGASKRLVYDGGRTVAEQPTRLFLDAQTVEGWRRLHFFPVLDAQNAQASLLRRMLEQGHKAPLVANARLPDDLDISIYRENVCPHPDQFNKFVKGSQGFGMPFAVTGLPESDYQTLQRWLAEGSPLDQSSLQPTTAEAQQIAQWEALLNAPGARQALVGRWLFEHLFLAHLYFEEGGAAGHFFQVVRSRTPSGQPVDPIATRRPNEAPGLDFYYRIRPIEGVIVHKTHITYPLSPQKLARVNELFFSGSWTASEVPGYGMDRRANPFETFAEIPAQARYQFMLDNAEYFVRTFIRGPVCRGQIATDVIRDHFWTLFQDPQHDLYITDANFRAEVDPLLKIPGLSGNLSALISDWPKYRDRRNQYQAARDEAYADAPPPGWSQIWTGNDNALLTIFRHFDSASVNKGLLGAQPRTMWLMDFPLLERTYYQLVVNFDVYGTVSEQAQTRLYFDLIRNGAEENLLSLLPPDSRQDILDSWYEGIGGKFTLWSDYQAIDSETPTGLELPAQGTWKAFGEQLLAHTAALNVTPDPINRCTGTTCSSPDLPAALQDAEQSLSGLTPLPAGAAPFILQMPEATLLRIELPDGSRGVYSLLRNRAHTNVAFMLGESLRYKPEEDTLTVAPGVLSSYPNFLFNLQAADVAGFVDALQQVQDQQGFRKVVERWGVRRSNPQFWTYFNDLSQYIHDTDPLQAGVLDMNRFENL